MADQKTSIKLMNNTAVIKGSIPAQDDIVHMPDRRNKQVTDITPAYAVLGSKPYPTSYTVNIIYSVTERTREPTKSLYNELERWSSTEGQMSCATAVIICL